MRELGSCAYRVELDDDEHFYCRHTSVIISRNVVTRAICRYCLDRTKPCTDPRPMPESVNLNEIPKPNIVKRAFNLSAAVVKFVSDGMKLVDKETYAERIAVCESCEFRCEDHCSKCGCRLTLKAAGRAFACPAGKWDSVKLKNGNAKSSQD